MISVIIPVYNSEKFLKKCIDSIINQSFSDYEVILVDDGSNDNSGLICDWYQSRYSNIKAIHGNNGGPSIARNEAVKFSKGELITFIDSDDYVTNDYLETLYVTLISNNADISIVLMSKVEENEEPRLSYKRETAILSGREALLNVLYQKDIDTTPCGMLFKRNIVIANPFPVKKYHEDDFTMFKYFESSDVVCLVREVKYFYVQHTSSIMHTYSKKIIEDELEAADNLVNYFSEVDSQLLKAAISKKFSNYCQVLLKDPEKEHLSSTTYSKIDEFLKETALKILFDNKTRLKNKIAAATIFIGGVKGLFFLNNIILRLSKLKG